MKNPAPNALFIEAYRQFLAGRTQEALATLPALDALDAGQASTWWRLRGMLHQHAGEYPAAEAAYARAAAVVPPASLRFGEARFAAAVLLGLQGRRDEAVAAYLDARERLRAHRRYTHLALVNYNLGWSLSQLMRLDLAAEAFERDLLSTERGEARQHAGLLHYGRAYLWTLGGERVRALGSLAWAAEAEGSVDVRARILHLRAQLLWLEGEREAASALSGELRSDLTPEASRLTRSSAILTDAIFTGNVGALQDAARQEEHSVRVRARLHLAGTALQLGDPAGAARHLRAALSALPTPAQLQFEAPFLRELYAWGRHAGFELPQEAAAPVMKAEVHVHGTPRLVVDGRPVHLELSPEAAAIASRLCEVPEESQDVLCRYVLGRTGPSGRAALARALRRLRLAFGTQECLLIDKGTVRTDRRWSWTAVGGKGPVAFSGIDSDYARDVELRRS